MQSIRQMMYVIRGRQEFDFNMKINGRFPITEMMKEIIWSEGFYSTLHEALEALPKGVKVIDWNNGEFQLFPPEMTDEEILTEINVVYYSGHDPLNLYHHDGTEWGESHYYLGHEEWKRRQEEDENAGFDVKIIGEILDSENYRKYELDNAERLNKTDKEHEIARIEDYYGVILVKMANRHLKYHLTMTIDGPNGKEDRRGSMNRTFPTLRDAVHAIPSGTQVFRRGLGFWTGSSTDDAVYLRYDLYPPTTTLEEMISDSFGRTAVGSIDPLDEN